MISNYYPQYLFGEDQSDNMLQFPKSPESFEISSFSCKSCILGDDFNQAYNDVFNINKMNDENIEPDEGHINSDLFSGNNIKSINEGSIITEKSIKIIIGSTKKKVT